MRQAHQSRRPSTSIRRPLIARTLPAAAIVPLVGYAYAVEGVSPYWPVWPIEWRVVAELGFLASAFAS